MTVSVARQPYSPGFYPSIHPGSDSRSLTLAPLGQNYSYSMPPGVSASSLQAAGGGGGGGHPQQNAHQVPPPAAHAPPAPHQLQPGHSTPQPSQPSQSSLPTPPPGHQPLPPPPPSSNQSAESQSRSSSPPRVTLPPVSALLNGDDRATPPPQPQPQQHAQSSPGTPRTHAVPGVTAGAGPNHHGIGQGPAQPPVTGPAPTPNPYLTPTLGSSAFKPPYGSQQQHPTQHAGPHPSQHQQQQQQQHPAHAAHAPHSGHSTHLSHSPHPAHSIHPSHPSHGSQPTHPSQLAPPPAPHHGHGGPPGMSAGIGGPQGPPGPAGPPPPPPHHAPPTPSTPLQYSPATVNGQWSQVDRQAQLGQYYGYRPGPPHGPQGNYDPSYPPVAQYYPSPPTHSGPFQTAYYDPRSYPSGPQQQAQPAPPPPPPHLTGHHTRPVPGGHSPLHATTRPVKPKRKRATTYQVNKLNEVFEQTFFPSSEMRMNLAMELGMTPRTVQIWFQNKRQVWRSEHNRPISRELGPRAKKDA